MADLALQQRAVGIADRVASAEIKFQRMCGAEWIDAYTRGWKVWDSTYFFVIYGREHP